MSFVSLAKEIDDAKLLVDAALEAVTVAEEKVTELDNRYYTDRDALGLVVTEKLQAAKVAQVRLQTLGKSLHELIAGTGFRAETPIPVVHDPTTADLKALYLKSQKQTR